MSNIIEIFKTITKIQRCSGNHTPFIDFMQDFAKKHNYLCLVDDAKNILCKQNNSESKLILQSHYDIVCLECNKIPTIIEDGDILKALDSTLGADNGMGCSYMLGLMQEGFDCEFLFTSDEEIGLIGANNLSLEINSKYMLNLDSEEEGEICIGCAGGVDIKASFSNKKIVANSDNLDLYEVSISNLAGGHSGVDIDKNIPNAIKLLIEFIVQNGAKVLDINAGERINSIPANAKAIIASNSFPKSNNDLIKIEKVDTKCEHFVEFDNSLFSYLNSFKNGVRDFNTTLNVVEDSINLALIKTTQDEIIVEFSARSMKNENLQNLKNETKKDLEDIGCSVETYGKYSAWTPDINDFTNKVLDIYKTYNSDAKLQAIHAGLECAVFKEKFPNLKIASIGPTINFPHSKKEQTSIKSCETLYKIVKDIVKSV